MSEQAVPADQADLLRDQLLLLQSLFTAGNPAQLPGSLQTSGKRAALADRGLQAYRANAGALAERALMAAYPVLCHLMGNESFAPLARYFWQHAPPQRGVLRSGALGCQISWTLHLSWTASLFWAMSPVLSGRFMWQLPLRTP